MVPRRQKTLLLKGCGLQSETEIGKASQHISVNVTAPHIPITTDGKEPDLSHFSAKIREVVKKACARARRAAPKEPAHEKPTQKEVVNATLQGAIDKASGGGLYRFNQRQLFYVIRPLAIEAGSGLSWSNFTNIITEYEAEHGGIPGMYRDVRGSLYHPHTGETIPLGTLEVEQYRRPEWTFNKVLYIEKEGLFETLKSAKWPERNDCALLSSKGYATRAVRDLLDLLGDTGEPLTFFCIHDADADGTKIYETLQGETRARAARRVQIINLGLEPWEALEMGLDTEAVSTQGCKAVASYVGEYGGKDPAGILRWPEWLQHNRVELNAMTSPQFLAWLDAKMAAHGGEKVIPPEGVVADRLQANIRTSLHEELTERILREAKVDEQVESAFKKLRADLPDGEEIRRQVAGELKREPAERWTEPLDRLAAGLIEGRPE